MPGGHPTDYDPKFVAIAQKLGELGATDIEVAEVLQVSIRTIYNWKREHPEFLQALKLGKDGPDDRVEESLLHRALGYSVESEKILVVDGEVLRVPYIEHYPPDATSMIFWLKNRRPDRWRNSPDGGGDPDHVRKIIIVNDPDAD